MKRIITFFMLCAFISIGMRAAITITPANNIYVGGTAYSGYGIYGAKAGELALLLSGDNSVTVQWNGANLNQLKSAVLIKVGSSSNPNVLNDDDLEALELLSGARFLDIDGSTLAEGANIAKIKAGSNIEAVTLPNQLTKEQVNAAGASLKACNTNFGSCMSLEAEMEEKEIYVYTHPCTSAEVEYTGTVTGGSGHLDNITCPLTEAGSTFTYINTKFRNELSYGSASEVTGDKIVPNPLKVELTKLATPKTSYQMNYNGQTITVPDYAVNKETNTVSQDFYCAEINGNTSGATGADVTVVTVEYTYTTRNWQNENVINDFTGTPLGDETNGYYTMIENVYTPQYGFQFDVTSNYNYTYTDPTDTENPCSEKTASYTDGPHTTIDIPCDMDVDLTAKTVNVPVPGKNVAVCYVNTPGSLYQSVSLDVNDAASVEGLIISGNINNADIAVHSGATDPSASQNDADKFESTGATAAFYVNNKPAPIKSVDMSDAVIANYRHLRVLSWYAASLESVVFPKTVTRIPNYCCSASGGIYNQNLTNIVFPTEATTLTIGDYAFYKTPITSLLLPSSTTQVGDFAFATCPNLYDVEMEALNADCYFGNNVFEQCPALQHVTLSEKVKNIGDYMFNQCGLLESIRIPSTCTTIGSSAFQFCFSIHEVTIPEGVELIKLNAFEGAGLTDLYIMATSIDKLPKIYAMSPSGDGPSTFTRQRTTGNNTVPTNHRDDLPAADVDDVMSWYQEEQSGSEGLGTGNCLTALHYPESMKPFFEAIDVTEFYKPEELATIPMQTIVSGIQRYYTPEEYLEWTDDKTTLQAIVDNKIMPGYESNFPTGATSATDFGVDEDGNTILYQFLPQSYAVDPKNDNSGTRRFGPDKDGRYYPNQASYSLRLLAGATSTQAGGVGGEEVASAWGWRQFPLSSSIESIGEVPFEKEYDDTWYTMCFPWRMIDNQLFSAFNQKLEIVEFKGAEVFQDPEDEYNYNLVFHFDEVAKTYYMDHDGVEYERERDGSRVDGAGHNLYVYTSKIDGTKVKAPNPLPDKNSTDVEAKEQYGKYLTIQNVMVLPGHPYMIHPSIGAAPGNPATVYINGVKKIVPGEGLYASYATLADVAESQKQEYTVTSKEAGSTAEAEPWLNPVTGKGGKYTFIGNINDEVNGDKGAQDMPTQDGPVYFLGVKPGTVYPQFFKKKQGKGAGMWSQYSAIIVPDADAIANVEGLDGMSAGSSSVAPAKGYDVVFGEWEIVDEATVVTAIENAQAEAEETGKPAQITHMNVVYNIKGQVVRADSSSVEGLPKGLYIVNGKKYMVK